VFAGLADSGPKPLWLAGPSDARAMLDSWHPPARRHRVNNNETFSTLLWDEI
jgi:hypothetical protein